MAKVTGPLYSMTASGKIADAMVFFSLKGRAVVRQWLIPANPKTESQGNTRLIMGGVGRAVGAVKKTSTYAGQLITLGLVPTDQSKQSYLVKRIIEAYCADATAFEAEYTEYAAHTAKAAFDSSAISAGLVAFDISYKGTTNSFVAGLQLYLLAKAAIGLAFTGTPFDTSLATWTATETAELVASLAAAA